MKIGYVQLNIRLGQVKENVKHAESLIKGFKEEIDLLVLPELFNTGYAIPSFDEALRLAERFPEGYTSQKLSSLAEELGAYIVAGFAELYNGRVYNSAGIYGPQGPLGVYRKVHLFYKEKLLFTPGSEFRVFELNGFKLGVMICFDWIFPEAARILALGGADIIAHPANLVLPYAPTAMLARSVENRVYTITANRVGEEKLGGETFRFIGMSQVTSPRMEILCRAPRDGEEVRVVDVNLDLARSKKITEFNDLWEDRRPELYKPLVQA